MVLHLLCGIPGSGKSTVAQRIPGFIVSTDSIRKFLWQDEAIVEHDRLVFQLAGNIMHYLGKDVIFDATNVTTAKRKPHLDAARKHGTAVIVH